MSDEPGFLELYERNKGQKQGNVSGTIEGTVTNLATGIPFDFFSTWNWRDTQGGTLRFFGNMDDPEEAGDKVAVGVEFYRADQESDVFELPHTKIRVINFWKYKGQQSFKAASGRLEFHRYPDARISGSMNFTSVTIGGISYKVQVNYDLDAPA